MKREDLQKIIVFGELMRTHDFIINKALNEFGLYKGQPYILNIIKDSPGMAQKELAEQLNVTKSTIGASIRRMEKSGLLIRKQDEKDARCNRIYITDKGLEALINCHEAIYKITEAMYSKFSKEEEERVLDILIRLKEGLSEIDH